MKKFLSFALIICHLSSQLIASQDENKDLEYGAMPVAPFPYVAVRVPDNEPNDVAPHINTLRSIYPINGSLNFFEYNCVTNINQSSSVAFAKCMTVGLIVIILIILANYRMI